MQNSNKDPSTLTVLNLIQVLTQHNIPLPSTRQKKQFYIDLFNQHLQNSKVNSTEEGELFQNTQDKENHFTNENPFQKSAKTARTPKTPMRNTSVFDNLSVPSPKFTPYVVPQESSSSPIQSDKGKESEPASTMNNKSKIIKPKSGKSSNSIQKRNLSLGWILGLLCILLSYYIWIEKDLSFCSPSVEPKKTFWNIPLCLPCPSHSICSSREITGCDSSQYSLQSWSSLIPKQYLPWPFHVKRCKDATHLLEKEAQLLYKVQGLLNGIVSKWMGGIECQEIQIPKEFSWIRSSSLPNGRLLGMPISLAKKELEQIVFGKKKKTVSESSFEDLWQKLLQRILAQQSLDGLEMILDDTHHRYRLFQTQSPLSKSYSCQFKMGLVDLTRRYSIHLLMFAALLGIVSYLYSKYQSNIKESMVVTRLIDDIMDAVQQESQRNVIDPVRHPLPGLVVSQLKEHFLPVHVSSRIRIPKPIDGPSGFACELDSNDRIRWYLDETTRERVWKRVYNHVTSHASIRESAMELNGEGVSVWIFQGSHSLGTPKKAPAVVSAF